MDIRDALEKLSLTQAWSLRETDLYDFQRKLDRIDESRIDGNFEDENGHKADLFVQRVSATYLTGFFMAYKPTDTAVPASSELCLHLQSYAFLRTGV